MSAFDDTRDVEGLARSLVLPWLNEKYPNILDFARDDATALEIQFKGIDFLVVKEPSGTASRDTVTVELKAERRTTGNLFLETWSNRPKRRGWIYTSLADRLLYCFLDTRAIYVAHMGQLQEWAIAHETQYAPVVQRRYQQRNETVGMVVPIVRLTHEIDLRRFYVRSSRRNAA